MRRWVAALTALSIAVLAGCARPAGADGNLIDDWPAHPTAAVPVPVAGICYGGGSAHAEEIVSVMLKEVASCDTEHSTETIFVGTFKGSIADAPAPPDGSDLREAYGECDRAAKEFLGDDWHNGMLALRVFGPTPTQWRGGARFLRCDLAQLVSEQGTTAPRKASLKDALRGDRAVARGCVRTLAAPDNKTWDDFIPIACTQPHGGEFAGFYVASERPYPANDDQWDVAVDGGCADIVFRFLGMTRAQYEAHTQVYYSWWGVGQSQWEMGDRTASCYVTLADGVSVSRSLKGMGNKRL